MIILDMANHFFSTQKSIRVNLTSFLSDISCWSIIVIIKVVLRANDNSFVGTIRDGFDQWKNLDFADFRNNGFEGTLPSTIFDIPTIRILYFANNNIDGGIPSTYGNSPVLRDLFLSGNQLTGTIPEIQAGQLTSLTELLLEDVS